MTIVLFDGVCNLCNSIVLFLIKHDTEYNLHFAAQQSEAGKNTMHQHAIRDREKSVIVIKDELVFYKSDAIIEIAKLLTGWPSIFKYTKILPKFLRDGIYSLVSKNRYSIFGIRNTCMTPSNSIRERFMM